MLLLQFEGVFVTLLVFICHFIDFDELLCKMLKKKKGYAKRHD